jgi:hypothetical protein
MAMNKGLASLVLAAATLLAPASSAFAAPAFALHGTATLESGHVRLTSDFSDGVSSNDSGAIDFTGTGVTTFSSLTALSADFNVTDDSCGGGSPRFQLNVNDKNVFVYFGPTPNFTGCASGWQSTGNLIGSTDARFDLSQLFPGTQSSTYAQALQLIGSQTVTGIQLAVDGGWFFADKEQTILVDNVTINGTTFTFEEAAPGGGPSDKEECKNGGWKTFSNPSFKNQGQCVSSVVSHRDHDGDDEDDDDGDD